MNAAPKRGEIWTANFNPTLGREQAGIRPALVVSVDGFNNGPADLVILAPITSKDKRIPLHVAVDPPEGGLTRRSFIKCEDVRSVSRIRLMKCIGAVFPTTMAEVEDRLRIVMGL